ncbi:MAG: hypothetical protein MZV70_41965 [Desulfobacterales bacterium]|nr:hypothetical protein [Desulfobacterales bacterium]
MAAHMALAVRKGGRMNCMGSVMAILTVAHSAGMMAGALHGRAGNGSGQPARRVPHGVGGHADVHADLLFRLQPTACKRRRGAN